MFQSQEKGDTDHFVERLCQRLNLSTRAQEKCGKLLSTLLVKSWPKSTLGENTSTLDPVTVEFLLSWNSMAAYFTFFGIQFPLYELCMLIGYAARSFFVSYCSVIAWYEAYIALYRGQLKDLVTEGLL